MTEAEKKYHREWYHNNKERLLTDPKRKKAKKKSDKLYAKKHKDKLFIYRKQYAFKHGEKITAKKRDYYHTNRDKILKQREAKSEERKAYIKIWHSKNKAHSKSYRKKYCTANKEVIKIKRHEKFKSDVKMISGGYLKMLIRKGMFPKEVESNPVLLAKYKTRIFNKRDRARADKCIYCEREFNIEVKRTIDHLIPKANGGADVPLNKKPCCQYCNETKADKSLSSFLWFIQKRLAAGIKMVEGAKYLTIQKNIRKMILYTRKNHTYLKTKLI
jgi:hypothetical protein